MHKNLYSKGLLNKAVNEALLQRQHFKTVYIKLRNMNSNLNFIVIVLEILNCAYSDSKGRKFLNEILKIVIKCYCLEQCSIIFKWRYTLVAFFDRVSIQSDAGSLNQKSNLCFIFFITES